MGIFQSLLYRLSYLGNGGIKPFWTEVSTTGCRLRCRSLDNRHPLHRHCCPASHYVARRRKRALGPWSSVSCSVAADDDPPGAHVTGLTGDADLEPVFGQQATGIGISLALVTAGIA